MDGKPTFQKLTPKSDVDIKGYEEAFDFVFMNDDLKNVAISGAYSSGKSSVLESYKSKHPEQNFLHISLTHFCALEDNNQSEEPQSDNSFNEASLEGKILNQLIHHIPSDNIPQTSFKVKKIVKPKDILLLTEWVSIFVLSIAMLIFAPSILSFAENLQSTIIKDIFLSLFSPCARIISGIFCVICFVNFVYMIIKEQKTKNIFRKISFQGNEIEIFENQEDSYFDKYLNEVLYLFENVKQDVIVFEDIDRFDEPYIFERLREINTIVNTQGKKILRFFYLVRDDIFTSKDRTKFFDFIIPIIPVVDSTNAYEQLIIFLKESDMLNKLDLGFLQGISLYIDDMRILKNICNEFIVYINRLDSTELNHNKMMAMITYKNLFPSDFSDLQLSRGFVHELFMKKPDLINQTLAEYNSKKVDLFKRIELAKKETLVSKEELDDAYKAKKIRLSSDHRSNLSLKISEIKNQYNTELDQRAQAIQDNLENMIPELEKELDDIEHEISLLQSRALSELINRENIKDLFSINSQNELGDVNEYKEIKRSEYFDLLKFLIRNGHIDETYSDYMSYFYPGSLSTNDKIFLRRITDRRGSDYNYALKDPKVIIESPILGVAVFEQEEALNFDLFDYLLKNDSSDKNIMYLKTLISQIRKKDNFEFISEYYDSNKECKKLVIALNKQWPEFFSAAIQDNTIHSAQIRRFSIDSLYYSDIDDIEKINLDNCLSEYISQCSDYLNIDQPNIDKLISGFKNIGVLFENIDYELSNVELFNKVYENCLYAINFNNIKLMLKTKYNIDDDSELIHKNFTLIQSQPETPLANYISGNMIQYLEMIIENCNNGISDNEDVVISVLNHADIEESLKVGYIGSLTSKINDINQITYEELWKPVIEKSIVCFSADNCISYFIKFGLDQQLVGFINESPAEIDFSHAANGFDDNSIHGLCDAIVRCNEITTDKYQKILSDLAYVFDAFDASSIDKEKIEVLIKSKIIQMDPESISFIRNDYPDTKYTFIRYNFNHYLELQNDIFDLDETLQIINWDDINDDQKIALLKFTGEPISVADMNYSDELTAYIISNNFDASDMPILFEKYSQYREKTKNAIVELATNNVSNIISHGLSLDDGLLSILLTSEKMPRKQKILIFESAIPKMNENSCSIHLDELGLNDLKNIFSKSSRQRKFDKNEETDIILKAFKSRQWILDFQDDEDNHNKYMVTKNKT